MEATHGLNWQGGEAAPPRRAGHLQAASPASDAIKRLLDITVASLTLLATSPVLLLIAVAIRLDSPGPCLFRQRRTGRHGHRFWMYKFRTMVRDAEEQKSLLKGFSHLPAPNFKVRSDPRVTRVGSVLRTWSLDELPNLVNVIRGEMSLVGPRPTSWSPEQYEPPQLVLLTVRPGVTGLWQVNGRADVAWEERVLLEHEYLRRRSLALDLSILVRTIPAVLSRRGAY